MSFCEEGRGQAEKDHGHGSTGERPHEDTMRAEGRGLGRRQPCQRCGSGPPRLQHWAIKASSLRTTTCHPPDCSVLHGSPQQTNEVKNVTPSHVFLAYQHLKSKIPVPRSRLQASHSGDLCPRGAGQILFLPPVSRGKPTAGQRSPSRSPWASSRPQTVRPL